MTSDDSMPSGEAGADPAAAPAADTVAPAPETVASALDLGSLPASIGYMLRRASLAVNHDLASRAAAIDLRPAQFAVLAIIDRNPGLRQTQVAEALQIKKTNFVALLDALEARGLVRRERVAADRRSYALHLTPQGRDILAAMRQIETAHEAELRQHIGPENAALFMQLLARLAQSRRADSR
jgi:DNA-binding MarR family transcriptional regulator